MVSFKTLFWLSIAFAGVFINLVTSANLYALDEPPSHTVTSQDRVRRQTHPAATIAKLPTQDTGAFMPIVGPTQATAAQQTAFSQTNDFFANTIDFPNLQNVPNTLVDYLVPPSPDSLVTTLNFQDPAANLLNVENSFDIAAPTSSPDNFQQLQNSFQQAVLSFHNQNQYQPQLNTPVAPTTPTSFNNDPVPNLAFPTPPATSSVTPSPFPSSPSPTTNVGNFFSNKISNAVVNRDSFSQQLNNVNHPSSSQFIAPLPPTSFPKNEAVQEKPSTLHQLQAQLQPQSHTHFSQSQLLQQSQSQQPTQSKWELGYDANEILAPPRDESFGRASEYDTINVAKLRRPSTNLNPPTPNIEPPVNQIQPPNQFFSQFSFNKLPAAQNTALNDAFVPIANQLTLPNTQAPQSQFTPPRETISDQANVVWGSQKQQSHSFNPTTNAPFLPTIPPSPSPQQAAVFHSAQQSSQNFQNSFNPLPPPVPQHLQFQPQLHSQPLFDLNQNYPLNTPLTSQFDTFLPQGTVADHTFQLFNENLRHFQKKRQVTDEEAEEPFEEEPQSNYHYKQVGRPVYSYVKTDRDGHFKWSVRHTRR